MSPRFARCVVVPVLVAGLTAACSDAPRQTAPPTTPAPTHATAPPTTAPNHETAPPTTAAPTHATAPTPRVHATAVPPLHPSVDGYASTRLEIETAGGARHRLAVLVATTAAERSHGLMEVPDLPAGAGMWFVYETEREGGFWMKNTLVPLDIAYVRADGRIGDIQRMEPCPADPCPTYPPAVPYLHALEVPAGWFGEQGIAVGDEVRELD